MKTKKNSQISAGIVTLTVVLVISIISCVIFSLFPGEDYTNVYRLYSEVKDITDTYALMDYCHQSCVDYSISNGRFYLKGYKITFTLNKRECSITNDNRMNQLALLDSGCYDFMENTDDGQLYKLKTWGTNYTKCNGTYTVYNTWPSLIAFGAIVIFAIALAQQIYFTALLNRKKNVVVE